MNKAELLEELAKLNDLDDEETAHVKADKLLLRFIDDADVTLAYEKIDKWYA